MKLRGLSLSILYLATVSVGSADVIEYQLSVDTGAIHGTVGSLDFNFNPGPLITQAASLQILGFASDGSLAGGPSLTGNVSGTLPAAITFDNGSGFNDYFGEFTFGSILNFDVKLYGPALSSPDGVSTSGSTFAFSMYSDSAGTTPVLTRDTADGFAVAININLDGTTTATHFSQELTIGSVTSAPEPNSGSLFALAAVSVWWFRLKRRSWKDAHKIHADPR